MIRGRALPAPLARIATLRLPPGISAIMVKELRGRMRGRRAFVILTIHVLLLTVFAWMFQQLGELNSRFSGFGGTSTFASASVGRTIFLGLLMLQTLIVAVLAPAATAGAISSEREHQTLELLAVTPISSLSIVLGKLVSALTWIFLLVLASIPVTAMVFVYGGVAPEDVIRGYLVLFATVIGLGSVGIFFSTLTRRTGASTGLTFVVMLVLVVGSVFVYVFMLATSETNANGVRRQPPAELLYLNPFVAQADVACGTEQGNLGGTCSLISAILPETQPVFFPDRPSFPEPAPDFGGGAVGADGIGVLDDAEADVFVQEQTSFRDRFWPRSVLAYLGLATMLTIASVQLVTPTRRWRPSLPARLRFTTRRNDP